MYISLDAMITGHQRPTGHNGGVHHMLAMQYVQRFWDSTWSAQVDCQLDNQLQHFHPLGRVVYYGLAWAALGLQAQLDGRSDLLWLGWCGKRWLRFFT
jgi:hypothetical protein